jgi:hypothetical protein
MNSKTTTSSQQPTLQSKGCEDPEERTGSQLCMALFNVVLFVGVFSLNALIIRVRISGVWFNNILFFNIRLIRIRTSKLHCLDCSSKIPMQETPMSRASMTMTPMN